MFAYCENNPINYEDPVGTYRILEGYNPTPSNDLPRKIAILKKELKTLDLSNTSEELVLNSKYVAGYKGTVVFRTSNSRSFTFFAVFLRNDLPTKGSNSINELRHEYGHLYQLAALGSSGYLLFIGIPSILGGDNPDYYKQPWEVTADLFGGVDRMGQHNYSDQQLIEGLRYLRTAYIISRFTGRIW